jgi:nicotinic acid phosphoribosyltransferase
VPVRVKGKSEGRNPKPESMKPISEFHCSALLTDLYEVTMAYGYWKTAKADHEAVFHLSFRKNPFGGGFTLCSGLADAIDFLAHFRFKEDELRY